MVFHKKYYLNVEAADVFFICGTNQERIPAHSFILCEKSDVFKMMFEGRSTKDNEIIFRDVPADVFKTFLRFFYCFSFTTDFQNMCEIMDLVKRYNIGDRLGHNHKLTIPNGFYVGSVINAYELSIKYNFSYPALTEVMETYVLNPEAKLFELSLVTLKRVLALSYLRIDSARLFDACINWAKKKCASINPTFPNLQNQLAGCLQSIGLGSMDSQGILKCIEEYGGLFTPRELQIFLVRISARCPSPFHMLSIKKPERKIARKTSLKRYLEFETVEVLTFAPRRPGILFGIKIADILHATNTKPMNISAVVAVSRNAKLDGKDCGEIVLLKQRFNINSFSIEDVQCAFSGHNIGHWFKEAIAIYPGTTVIIKITFSYGDCKCTHNIYSIEDHPDFIFQPTNAKAITSLYVEHA